MTSALVEQAREAIGNAGPLLSSADLARRWHISRAHAHRLTHDSTFPEPDSYPNGSPVWLASAADGWYFDPIRALRRVR
jgi:predicted DNA-binding transcriptional regulator AlpA